MSLLDQAKDEAKISFAGFKLLALLLLLTGKKPLLPMEAPGNSGTA